MLIHIQVYMTIE